MRVTFGAGDDVIAIDSTIQSTIFSAIYIIYKFDLKKISYFLQTMDEIGKPIEVNRKFIKFIEEDIEPEYNRVFEMLLQQLKDDLDHKYTDHKYTDEKYLKKGQLDNT